MNKRIIIFALTMLILILELLPYGAVLRFMSDPHYENEFVEYFSYFSLVPFGYANFGPLLTAILTTAISITSLFYLLLNKERLCSTITSLSAIATLTSLLPLFMGGVRYLTTLSVVITLLLLTLFIASIFIKNKKSSR